MIGMLAWIVVIVVVAFAAFIGLAYWRAGRIPVEMVDGETIKAWAGYGRRNRPTCAYVRGSAVYESGLPTWSAALRKITGHKTISRSRGNESKSRAPPAVCLIA